MTTKRLNEQVKGKLTRFPTDFMFRLTPQEFADLRSQIATSNIERRRRRYLPMAFTEHGAVMLASVQLRNILAAHAELAQKLDQLERKYDARFRVVFHALRRLMEPPAPPEPKRIGFRLGGSLVQAVKRNPGRFPSDFLFQLTPEDLDGAGGAGLGTFGSAHSGAKHSRDNWPFAALF